VVTNGRAGATAILKIRGIGDAGQARRLRHAAAGLDGVLGVDINYILDSVTVKYDADKLTSAQVKRRLTPNNHATVTYKAGSEEDSKVK
jgi:hypothetical protein